MTINIAKPCEKLSKPLDKDPPVLFSCGFKTIGNSKVMHINFTVVREYRNLKIKQKSFKWENRAWKILFNMNVGCKGMFLPFMSQTLNLKYDSKKCAFLPGVYISNNVDVNHIQHQWVSSLEYGKTKWSIEMLTDAGVAICWEFIGIIVPEKN